jgi:hypothetical protein
MGRRVGDRGLSRPSRAGHRQVFELRDVLHVLDHLRDPGALRLRDLQEFGLPGLRRQPFGLVAAGRPFLDDAAMGRRRDGAGSTFTFSMPSRHGE